METVCSPAQKGCSPWSGHLLSGTGTVEKTKFQQQPLPSLLQQEASPLSQGSPSLGTLMMAAYMTRYTLDTGLSLPCKLECVLRVLSWAQAPEQLF